MIDPHSGVPAWRQLADELRARINSGEWPPGALLPPQPRIQHEYAVGKATVKAAVAALRSEGLVDLEHGIGIRVREPSERQEVRGESGSVVSVRMPTPAERAAFGLADGVPMLVVTGPDGLQEAYPGDEYVLRIG